MLSFYKDSNGRWYLNGRLTSPYQATMCIDSNNVVHIEPLNASIQEFEEPLSGIKKENGESYATYDELLSGVGDFFVEAPISYPEYAYGEIYGANNLNTSTIPQGSTYTKAVPFNSNGLSLNTTVDHTLDQIAINVSGVYIISAVFSTAINQNNTTLDTAVFKNGIECPNLHGQRLIVNSNYISVNGLSGIVRCNSGDIIDVRCKHDYSGNVTLSTKYSNLSVKYIGS